MTNGDDRPAASAAPVPPAPRDRAVAVGAGPRRSASFGQDVGPLWAHSPSHPVHRFGLAIGLGAAVAAATSIAAGDGSLPGDVRIARWVQDAPVPFAAQLAAFGNALGSAVVGVAIAVVLVAALAAVHHRREAVFLLVVFLARVGNGAVKELTRSPRPTAGVVRVTELASGYGFPSGHAMGATLLFGGIAYVTSRVVQDASGRRIVVACCVSLILVTGYGRVYVGAHWPSDVLGGYLWGALILTVAIRIDWATADRRGPAKPGITANARCDGSEGGPGARSGDARRGTGSR